MRRAFSMITAIFLIVLMAGLLALVSSLSGKIVKTTTAQYRKEQAALLAKSYTEYAILAIQGHHFANNRCLRTITAGINSLNANANAGAIGRGEGYQVEVKVQYIGINNAVAMNPAIVCPATGISVFDHSSVGDQNNGNNLQNLNDLYATIDVYVMYHDMLVVDTILANGGAVNNQTPWITFHRRTLQKL
jgi:hypothetical protein